MLREKTACFTGYRKTEQHIIESMLKKQISEMEKLINQGVTRTISDGALGFDTLAASMVIV